MDLLLGYHSMVFRLEYVFRNDSWVNATCHDL